MQLDFHHGLLDAASVAEHVYVRFGRDAPAFEGMYGLEAETPEGANNAPTTHMASRW